MLLIVKLKKSLPPAAHFAQLSVRKYFRASSWSISSEILVSIYFCFTDVVCVGVFFFFTHSTANTAAVGTHIMQQPSYCTDYYSVNITFFFMVHGREAHTVQTSICGPRATSSRCSYNRLKKVSNKLQPWEATGWNRVSAQGLLLCGSRLDICTVDLWDEKSIPVA